MILGMSPLTFLHVLISLVAIVAGLAALLAMLGGRYLPVTTGIFLAFTVLTSITGLPIKAPDVTPAQIVGWISLAVLIVALVALYGLRLQGAWRPVYVVTAIVALWLNCFVLIVQAFQKIGPLHMLAPNGSEPAFQIAQGVTLLVFLAAGWIALRRFRPVV